MIEPHLDARAWRYRPPLMMTFLIQQDRLLRDRLGKQSDGSAQTAGNRNRDFIDVDGQRSAVPGQIARANREYVDRAADRPARALCHGPTIAAAAIDGDIDGAMIERIGR